MNAFTVHPLPLVPSSYPFTEATLPSCGKRQMLLQMCSRCFSERSLLEKKDNNLQENLYSLPCCIHCMWMLIRANNIKNKFMIFKGYALGSVWLNASSKCLLIGNHAHLPGSWLPFSITIMYYIFRKRKSDYLNQQPEPYPFRHEVSLSITK